MYVIFDVWYYGILPGSLIFAFVLASLKLKENFNASVPLVAILWGLAWPLVLVFVIMDVFSYLRRRG